MYITIRNKEFKIELVNNYVRKLYVELTELCEGITDLIHEMQDELDNYKDQEDKTDNKEGALSLHKTKRQLYKEYREIHKKQKTELNTLKHRTVLVRNSILEEILISNNIEFDVKWWDHKADANDINELIEQCFKPNSTTKKKVHS